MLKKKQKKKPLLHSLIVCTVPRRKRTWKSLLSKASIYEPIKIESSLFSDKRDNVTAWTRSFYANHNNDNIICAGAEAKCFVVDTQTHTKMIALSNFCKRKMHLTKKHQKSRQKKKRRSGETKKSHWKQLDGDTTTIATTFNIRIVHLHFSSFTEFVVHYGWAAINFVDFSSFVFFSSFSRSNRWFEDVRKRAFDKLYISR